jgi:hypothetical protein
MESLPSCAWNTQPLHKVSRTGNFLAPECKQIHNVSQFKRVRALELKKWVADAQLSHVLSESPGRAIGTYALGLVEAPSTSLWNTHCERGSIQRPGWPGSSIKPKCW